MGANYEDVLKRLYNEGMICRFTLMFLNDDSYPKLEQALKEGNVKEAFRAAHTLKGVCQNLGFTNLYQPTYDLTLISRTVFRLPVSSTKWCTTTAASRKLDIASAVSPRECMPS